MLTAESLYAVSITLLPFILMTVFKLNIFKTALATLAYTLLIVAATGRAYTIPGSLLRGGELGIKIGLVIAATLLLYNVYRDLGFESRLRDALRGEEVRKTGIALAVYFSGFMESVSGFGISVAVSAPVVAMLGISPATALSSTLIGHSWAVPFAALGVPTAVLSSLTGKSLIHLFKSTGMLTTIPLLAITMSVARVLKTGARGLAVPLLASLALPLFSLAASPFAGLLASITAFTFVILVTSKSRPLNVLRSLSPYIAVATLLLLLNLLGLGGLLYTGLAIGALALSTHAFLGGKERGRLVTVTIRASAKPVAATIAFIVVAELARSTGFMGALARDIAVAAGPAFILFIPLIGAIGTYVTGSNTASNIIFAAFHDAYAVAAQLNPYLILALQNVGGGLGSMIAPSKITVGGSTLQGKGLETKAFKTTSKYFLPIIASVTAYAVAVLYGAVATP